MMSDSLKESLLTLLAGITEYLIIFGRFLFPWI